MMIFFSAVAFEIQQISDGEQTSSRPFGEECDASFTGCFGKRGIMVLHLPVLQAQIQWR